MKREITGYIATNAHTKEQLPIYPWLADSIAAIKKKSVQTVSKMLRDGVTGTEADEIKQEAFSAWEIAEAIAEIDAPEDKDWASCSMEASALGAWKPTARSFLFAMMPSVVTNFHPFGKYQVKDL